MMQKICKCKLHRPHLLSRGRIQRKTRWMGPMPELTITSPYVHSRVDFSTFIMGNPLQESTLKLNLCQSQLYPPVKVSTLTTLLSWRRLGQQVKKIFANLILYRFFILFRCRSVSDFPFWRQSRSGSEYICWKIRFFKSFIHSNACLHCFIFLVSVIGLIILTFWTVYWNILEKV
jgi:hypothetical protein